MPVFAELLGTGEEGYGLLLSATGVGSVLGTILVVNNLVNISIVLIATVVAEDLFPSDTLPPWLNTLIHVVGVTFLLVLFGEVIGVHIADELINEEGRINIDKLHPIARMGYQDYTEVTAETVFTLERPGFLSKDDLFTFPKEPDAAE